jgi:hypothetical protein
MSCRQVGICLARGIESLSTLEAPVLVRCAGCMIASTVFPIATLQKGHLIVTGGSAAQFFDRECHNRQSAHLLPCRRDSAGQRPVPVANLDYPSEPILPIGCDTMRRNALPSGTLGRTWRVALSSSLSTVGRSPNLSVIAFSFAFSTVLVATIPLTSLHARLRFSKIYAGRSPLASSCASSSYGTTKIL